MSIFSELLPKINKISCVFVKNFEDDLKVAFDKLDKFDEEHAKTRSRGLDQVQRVKSTLQCINEDEADPGKQPVETELPKRSIRTKSITITKSSEIGTEQRRSNKRSKNEIEGGVSSPEMNKPKKRNASVKAQSIISKQVNVNLTQKMRRENSTEKLDKTQPTQGKQQADEEKENLIPNNVPLLQVKVEKLSIPVEPEPMETESLPINIVVKQELNKDDFAMPPPIAPIPKPRKVVPKEKPQVEEPAEEETRRRRSTRTRKQTESVPPAPVPSERATRGSSRIRQPETEEPQPQPEARPKRTRAKKNQNESSTTEVESDSTQTSQDNLTVSPTLQPRPKRTRRGRKVAESGQPKSVDSDPTLTPPTEETMCQESSSPILSLKDTKLRNKKDKTILKDDLQKGKVLTKSNSTEKQLTETDSFEKTLTKTEKKLTKSDSSEKTLTKTNSTEKKLTKTNSSEKELIKTNSAENELTYTQNGNKGLVQTNSIDKELVKSDSMDKGLTKTGSIEQIAKTKGSERQLTKTNSNEKMLVKTKSKEKELANTRKGGKELAKTDEKEVAKDVDQVDNGLMDETRVISKPGPMDETVVLANGVYNHVPITPKNKHMDETVVLDIMNRETMVLDKPRNVIMDATVVIEKGPRIANMTEDNSLVTDDSDDEDDVMDTPPKTQMSQPQPTSAVKEKVQQFEEMATRVTRTKTRAMAKKEDQPESLTTPPDKISQAVLSSQTLAKMNSLIFNGKTPLVSTSAVKPRTNMIPTKCLPSSTSKVSALNKAKEAAEENLKREDARKKKEALLEAKREQQKKKREEKMLAAAAAREAAERERRLAMEAAFRERREKQAHVDLGKVERLKEQERKKQELARKVAETEERRRAEETARQQRLAEEQRRALQHRRKQQEEQEAMKIEAAIMAKEIEQKKREYIEKQKKQRLEVFKTPGTPNRQPAHPIEPVYMQDGFQYLISDEEDDPPKRPVPEWSTTQRRTWALAAQAQIATLHVDRLFSVRVHSPDLREIFPNIERARLKRTSSAVWRTPPHGLRALPE